MNSFVQVVSDFAAGGWCGVLTGALLTAACLALLWLDTPHATPVEQGDEQEELA